MPHLRRSDHHPGLIAQPFRAGLTFGGRPSGPRGGYQGQIASLVPGVEKGVPRLGARPSSWADTQPFRAWLTFGGRPCGPRGGYQGQISPLVSGVEKGVPHLRRSTIILGGYPALPGWADVWRAALRASGCLSGSDSHPPPSSPGLLPGWLLWRAALRASMDFSLASGLRKECRTYGARPSSWADTQPFRAGLTFGGGPPGLDVFIRVRFLPWYHSSPG